MGAGWGRWGGARSAGWGEAELVGGARGAGPGGASYVLQNDSPLWGPWLCPARVFTEPGGLEGSSLPGVHANR